MGYQDDGFDLSPPGPLVMGRYMCQSTWLAVLRMC